MIRLAAGLSAVALLSAPPATADPQDLLPACSGGQVPQAGECVVGPVEGLSPDAAGVNPDNPLEGFFGDAVGANPNTPTIGLTPFNQPVILPLGPVPQNLPGNLPLGPTPPNVSGR